MRLRIQLWKVLLIAAALAAMSYPEIARAYDPEVLPQAPAPVEVITITVPKVTVIQPPTKEEVNSTRALGVITVEKLSEFLRGSPLAPYSEQILQSKYWSTIIGICWIEQYSCTRAPYNNYWGIMKASGGLQHFSSIPEGIAAIDSLLARYETKGKDTINELNGYYVVPASATWYNTVVRIKKQVESLT